MNEVNMDIFYDNLKLKLNELREKEIDNIKKAAKVCFDSITTDGVIHVFGSGHSVGFGMELIGRAGSLVPFHSIVTSDFVLKGKVTLSDFNDPNNRFERRVGIADKLYDLYDVQPQDSFILISNSGINGLVIDLALKVKKEGHKIIVVTSMEHTTTEDSLHPSGKKLYELADVVIDNCGPYGDALLETGKVEKICSVSSITGAYIAQSLTAHICELMQEQNMDIPLLLPESTEDNINHNKLLKNKYGDRI